MSGLRIGSLFSGAGMLDEGVRSVIGGEVAWHSEVDPAASKVLAYRYPTVPNLGDITAVDWSTVEAVDVITGGSPCQDVSHAGKRAGMRAGTRSGLWASMCDAIDQLRPALVVWENVRGVLSAEADSALESCAGCVGDGDDGPVLRALGRVLGDLAELGYDCRWHGLRAADIGAPHGRFRIFVVATDAQRLGRERRSYEPLGSTVKGASATRAGSRITSDAQLVGLRTGRSHSGVAERSHDQSGGRCGASTSNTYRDALRQQPVSEPRGNRAAVAGLAGDASTYADDDGLQGVGRFVDLGRDTDRRSSADTAWGIYEPAIRRWEALTRPAPPPTEISPRGAQRLSPRFSEWMQGWPDGWVTDVPGVSRNDALKICGNGVVPQQAAEAARRLALTLERVA